MAGPAAWPSGAHPQTPRALGAGRRSGLWSLSNPFSVNTSFPSSQKAIYEDDKPFLPMPSSRMGQSTLPPILSSLSRVTTISVIISAVSLKTPALRACPPGQCQVPPPGQRPCRPRFRPCRCGRLRWPVAHRHRLELLHFPRPDRRRPSCRLPLSRCREASARPQDSDGLFRWGCGQGGPIRLTDAHPLRGRTHGKRVPGFQREPGLPGVACGKEGCYWVACGGDN